MADPLAIVAEAHKVVPIVYKTAAGVVTAPTAGASVASDHPEIATVVLEADNAGATVTGVAVGVANLSLVFEGHTDTMQVTVSAAAAATAGFNTAGAV